MQRGGWRGYMNADPEQDKPKVDRKLLRRVLSYTITASEQRLTMAKFDQCKPEWMPQASGLVKYFGGSWSKLLNLDLTPA